MRNIWLNLQKHKFVYSFLGIMIIIFVLLVIYYQQDSEKIYNSGLYSNETIPYKTYQYDSNEYRIIQIDEIDMVNNYYHDFMQKYVNDPAVAWELLSEEMRENNFNENINAFLTYQKNHTDIYTLQNEVVRYNYQYGNQENTITVEDSEGDRYIFHEQAVGRYFVEFSYK